MRALTRPGIWALGMSLCLAAAAQEGRGPAGQTAAAAPRAAARRWAVVIGINNYRADAGVPSLKYCADDAQALYEVLTTRAGYRPHDVLLITDASSQGRPTRSNLIAKLNAWMRLPGPNDMMLVFFAGHGVEHEGRAYLLPCDAVLSVAPLTGIALSYLQDQLRLCRASKKILILDACHSGSGRGEERMSSRMSRELEQAKGFVTLASCDVNQKSFEWPERRHGVFSYYLIEALRGAADRDRDGEVTATEVNRFVFDHVRRWAAERGETQTPKFISNVQGDLALAFLPHVRRRRREPDANAAEILFRVTPAGAAVEIDYERVDLHGGSMAVLRVAPGPHHIRVSKPGYAPVERVVTVDREGLKCVAKLALWAPESRLVLRSGRTLRVVVVRQTKQKLFYRLTKGGGVIGIPLSMVAECKEIPGAGHVVGEGSNLSVQVARPMSLQERERQLPKEIANSIDMRLVLIPSGEFSMGCQDSPYARPVRRVRISRAFYMGKYEVTVGQFRRFCEESGYRTVAELRNYGRVTIPLAGLYSLSWSKGATWWDPGWRVDDRQPVTMVTWWDAAAFCCWLSKREGRRYRLPTEAEWEYACRGGKRSNYYWGMSWRESMANVLQRGRDTEILGAPSLKALSPRRRGRAASSARGGFVFVAPVGSFPPNPFGLYDMAGNVAELCSDFYKMDYYSSGETEDPKGPEDSGSHIVRGGSFADTAAYATCWRRNNVDPGEPRSSIGFRVVCETGLRQNAPAPARLRPGLIVLYYRGQAFQQFVKADRSAQVAFYWGKSAPHPSLARDGFSIRWIGYLRAPRAGRYRFTILADGWARLTLGRLKTIPRKGWSQNSRPSSDTVTLPQGYTPIRIEYGDDYGAAGVAVYWSSTSKPLEIIPPSAFAHTPEQERKALNDPYTLGEQADRR